MHGEDRAGRQRFEDEIAVGHGVERIGRRPVEAERLGRHLAIDRIGRAGERRRAERGFVEPLARIGEPAAVAPEHFDIGEEVMAERHRLRALQMRETGHDGFGFLVGALDKGELQRLDLGQKRIGGIADIEAKIGRHLVVARAGGVEAPGGVADQLAQPRLDVHMDVFEAARKREGLPVDLGQHLAEPVHDRVTIGGGEDAGFGQHRRMSD